MWPTVKLKSLGFIQGNGVDKTINRDELSIKLLNYMDVYTYTVIDNKLNFQEVTAKKNKIKKCNLIESDVLFTPSSETPDDIAHASVVVEDLENVVYSYHVIRFRFHEKNKIDKYFLRYCLNQYSVQKYFTSRASGTTRYTLSKKDFENLSFQIPTNKQEQKAIATILSKVDEAIESTKQTINSAQKLKTSLMQNLLTGKIKPDGTKRKDDEFYYDEKLGKVPKGWDIESLNKLFNINEESLSTNTEPEFTFKYISIEMVDTEKINYEKCPIYNFKDAPGRARRVVKDNDILISGVRPNLKSFAIYNKPDSDNWIVTTGIYVLSAKKDVCSNYFFYQILSEIAEKQFHSYVAGTNYPAIGDRDLKRLKLLVPCYTEQKEISEKFKEVSELIKVKEIKLNKLEKLKKSLMQNLLTGKMRLDEKLIKELISHV